MHPWKKRINVGQLQWQENSSRGQTAKKDPNTKFKDPTTKRLVDFDSLVIVFGA
jgi:hypothetical protein